MVAVSLKKKITKKYKTQMHQEKMAEKYCSANVFVDTTCCSFLEDYTAPRVNFITPPESAYISCDTPYVCFDVTDLNGISLWPDSMLQVNINGFVYDVGDLYMQIDTLDSVTYRVCVEDVYNVPYISGADVCVFVQLLSDTVGNSYADADSYCFSLDLAGPIFYAPSPPAGSFVPEPSGAAICTLSVLDALTGISDSGIVISAYVNGVLYGTLDETEYALEDENRIILFPTMSGIEYLDTIRFCVDSLFDNALLCGPNNVDSSYCVEYIVDNMPPEVDLIHPPDSAHSSCCAGGPICIRITDISGVNPDATLLEIGGASVSGAVWTWFPDDSMLCGIVPATALCDSACGRMNIIIATVADSIGNASLYADTFFYIVDREPPYIVSIYPPCDTPSVAYDSVSISFKEDCSWFIEDSTCIVLYHRMRDSTSWQADTAWGDDPNLTWAYDSATGIYTVTFFMNNIMENSWESGDSVRICVENLSDSLDMDDCGFNTLSAPDSCCAIYLSSGGPTFSLVRPPSGSYISCTDTFLVVFTCRDEQGVDSASIQMVYRINDGLPTTVTYPDPSILFVGGADTSDADTVYFSPPVILADGESVYVEFKYAHDMLDIPSEASRGGWYHIDQTPPYISGFGPASGSVLTDPTPDFWAVLGDFGAGLDYESLCFIVDGTDTYYVDGTNVLWGAGDTAYFHTEGLGLHFCGGDTVNICVNVADETMPIAVDDTSFCPPNLLESCWDVTFDTGAPVLVPVSPGDEWIITCSSLDEIVVSAVDSQGIDWSTFHILIADACGDTFDYTYPLHISVSGDNATITPSPAISCEGMVSVSVQVEDILCNMTSIDYSFVIDHTAPEIISLYPMCDSLFLDIPTELRVYAYDSLSYPDPARCCVGIIDTTGAAIEVCGDTSSAITNVGDTIIISLDALGIGYRGGDEVCWWISQLSDYSDLCDPNYTSTGVGDTCCFEISSQGPLVELISPDAGDDGVLFIGCLFPGTDIRFLITDSDGFDESTIRLISICGTDTAVVTLGPNLMLLGDTLIWSPASDPCSECDTFIVSVEVMDNLSNPQRPNSFPMAIDRTPPDIVILNASAFDSAFSLTPTCSLYFPDNCSGADSMSVCCSLYSARGGWSASFCNTNDTIRWSGDTMLIFTDDFDVQPQDTLFVCFDQVSDNVDTCVNNVVLDTCYWIYIAQFGPVVTFVEPLPDSIGLVCPSDSIVVSFYDPDGLDTSTVNFEVNGTVLPIATNPYWINDTTIVYLPSFTSSPETIVVYGQADMLGYSSESETLFIYFDDIAPISTWLSPGSPIPGTVPPGTPDVILQIEDSLHSIDSLTIMVVIDGDTHYVFDGILEWFRSGDSLVYHSSVAFDTFFANDTFDICLTAGDSTGCGYSNILDTCWTVAVSAGAGPEPSLIIPSVDSAYIACRDSFVIAWYCDDPEGLRTAGAQISMRVNDGTTVIYDDLSGHIFYRGDTLFFIPPDTLYFPGGGFSDGDSFFVRVVRVEDALGNVTSDPVEYVFYIDWSGPEVLADGPIGDVVVTAPDMWFNLHDIDGIDTTTAVVSIWVNGVLLTTLHWGSDSMSWRSPDTLVVSGIRFLGGDSVRVCLDSIADSPDYCGPNWTTDSCFTFWLSQGGPAAELLVPLDGATITCDEIDMQIAMCDSQGILYDSLLIVVQHAAYVDTYDFSDIGTLIDTFIAPPTEEDICDTIIVHPVPIHNFHDGETVSVSLRTMDTLFNPSFDYNWQFYIDLSAPVGDNFVPADGETIYDWSSGVSATIYDEISYLDYNSLSVVILDNGVPWLTYSYGDAPVSYNLADSTFAFSIADVGSLWHEFHQYCIRVFVQDTTDWEMYCPPNSDTIEWCFTVGDDDTTGPDVIFYEMLGDTCLWDAMNPSFVIQCSLWDTSGIYDDNTDTSGQGIFVIVDTSDCPTLTDGGYLELEQMVYDPSTGFASTIPGAFDLYPPGTWLYFVIYAYDNDFDFDTTFDRALTISECGSCYFHETDPPEVWAIDPQDGWYVSCPCDSQKIIVGLYDENGVWVSEGTLEVNGAQYPIGTSPEIIDTGALASPGTTFVVFTPDSGVCWENGETVFVKVYGITDVYMNVMTDTFSYSFIIDWEPPMVEYSECYDTTLYLEELTEVEISMFDSLAGTDSSSIEITIEGKRLNGDTYSWTYTVGDNGVEYIDSTQTVKLTMAILPNLEIDNEDSVWIRVENVCDRTQSCAPNCIEEPYECIKFIAAEFECRAHPNPFTPDGNNVNDVAFFDYPKRFFEDATIYIYDMQGVELRKIEVGPEHTYTWDGKDSQNNECRPGVYLYVIEVDGEVICTGTVVLAR